MKNPRPQHCSLCGIAMHIRFLEGRNRLVCDVCGNIAYQNPSPAAGVLLVKENKLLLVKRSEEPKKGYWALPAGFQEIDESPEEAARREMHEETGLTVGHLELFDLVYNDVNMLKPVNMAVFLAREAAGTLSAGDDVCEAAFFPLSRLPNKIAFSQIDRYAQRLQPARI